MIIPVCSYNDNSTEAKVQSLISEFRLKLWYSTWITSQKEDTDFEMDKKSVTSFINKYIQVLTQENVKKVFCDFQFQNQKK